jgi:DinB superfamily
MTASAAAEPVEVSTNRKLTAQELEQGLLFLENTKNSVIGATKGLSPEQWRFKPAPDRWSIAENLDHIVRVQERVLGPVLTQLLDRPAPPAGWDYALADSMVIHQIPTRLNRYPSPEFVLPADAAAPAELLERLTANYARFAEHLESTPGLREHAADAPPLRVISKGIFEVADGYQWILAAAAHTERHAKQMLEVMADPGYPV